MTHELSKNEEMSTYFAKKFCPATPQFVVGRSYKASPKCKPEETLFDNWMDPSGCNRHSSSGVRNHGGSRGPTREASLGDRRGSFAVRQWSRARHVG